MVFSPGTEVTEGDEGWRQAGRPSLPVPPPGLPEGCQPAWQNTVPAASVSPMAVHPRSWLETVSPATPHANWIQTQSQGRAP